MRPASIARSARRRPAGGTGVPPRTAPSTMSMMTASLGREPIGNLFEAQPANRERRGHVLFDDRLGGVMTDAAGTAKEQHRRGHVVGQDHGIVAGAARQPVNQKAAALDAAFEHGYEPRMHQDRGLIAARLTLDLQPSAQCDLPRTGDEPVSSFGSRPIVHMTDVEA